MTPRFTSSSMCTLEELVAVERDALDRGVVGAHDRDVVLVDERHRVLAEPGLRASRPRRWRTKSSHPVRTSRMSPRAQLDALRGAARLELRGVDHLAGLEPVDALVAGEVEQHAATGEAGGLRDVEVARAASRW